MTGMEDLGREGAVCVTLRPYTNDRMSLCLFTVIIIANINHHHDALPLCQGCMSIGLLVLSKAHIVSATSETDHQGQWCSMTQPRLHCLLGTQGNLVLKRVLLLPCCDDVPIVWKLREFCEPPHWWHMTQKSSLLFQSISLYKIQSHCN